MNHLLKKIYLVCLIFMACSVSVHADAAIRVACVGDSITFGTKIEDRMHRSYPAQLGVLLGEGYEVKNFGRPGATLLQHGHRPYIKTKAFRAALAFEPEIVIIKLGTNDSIARNWVHRDDFVADYHA